MTKVIFMGTPEFSVPILEGLVREGYDVSAVVTQPDRPVGRKKILTAPPVKRTAIELGLPVYQPEKISQSEELAQLIALEPDLIITAAFGQFLPESLLQAAKIEAINVHASLLPKYRGGAPVHYAIMNGEQETCVTIMKMVKKMDAGDILSQCHTPIKSTDDVGSMFDRLSVLGRDLLLATLPKIISGEIESTPQEESKVTYSPNITREQERIDWNQTAQEIDWQIRGLCPWPVAYTMYQDTRWKIWQAHPVIDEQTTASPGEIIALEKDKLWIACGEQTILQIDRLQPAGKGQLSTTEFFNGMGQLLEVGEKVE